MFVINSLFEIRVSKFKIQFHLDSAVVGDSFEESRAIEFSCN